MALLSATLWVILIVVVLLRLGIRFVQQGTMGVVIRFGRFSRAAQPGSSASAAKGQEIR